MSLTSCVHAMQVLFGDSHLEQVKTKAALPDAAKRDLIVASIAVKYTQVQRTFM